MNNQLTILNGRTLGDMVGSFTCIQKNGCSVVDYIAISKHIKMYINYFKVLEFTEYSDHKPITLEIHTQSVETKPLEPLDQKYKSAPGRFIFNDDNKSSFCERQKNESSIAEILKLHNQLDIIKLHNTDHDLISKTINRTNEKFAEHIQKMATSCFKQTKKNPRKKTGNNPWFNWQTRIAKKELRKATKATSDFPTSNFIRENFYKVKSNYKRLLRNTRTKYFGNLNNDIEDGKVLNWQAFKKLKDHKNSRVNFDSHDMKKFENYFTELYSDKHKTIDNNKKHDLINHADLLNKTSTPSTILNKEFTIEEIIIAMKGLKAGKASSLDMISNEILKCLDESHKFFFKTL